MICSTLNGTKGITGTFSFKKSYKQNKKNANGENNRNFFKNLFLI